MKRTVGLAGKLAVKGRQLTEDERFTFEELQLAFRNRGIPLEALRYEITPTGLHYLLNHFDICDIDPASWRLEVSGLVERRLSLALDDLMRMPQATLPVTLECAGNGRAFTHPRSIGQPWMREAVSTANWTGVRLATVLKEAGLKQQAADVVFWGADHGIERGEEFTFARSLTPAFALREEMLLAHSMNGAPLEPQHGAPLRLVVPGWYGMASVKWLARIEAIDRPFDGFQQAHGYHYRQSEDEPGTPVTYARVRSLMVPPGFPDFISQARIVAAGRVRLTGRAWSGNGVPVTRVEVGIGDRWQDAVLGSQPGPYAWHSWRYDWDAAPGEYELACRATDAEGNIQPLEQWWTLGGMGNNIAHKIAVLVRPA
jgi:DMSO/TMAO reductase YedYZ molybdopterin-dependent catalytic subunit